MARRPDPGNRAERPAWADEPVAITEPDPGWAAQARCRIDELRSTLAPWLCGTVDHVGSTAVPGLPAKPVIDLQAVIADLDGVEQIARRLAPASWHAVPAEFEPASGHRLLVHVVDGRRAAHLHLHDRHSPVMADRLAFRDALRADAVLADRYASLKRALAAAHARDREAYTEAKAGFVRNVLAGKAPRR